MPNEQACYDVLVVGAGNAALAAAMAALEQGASVGILEKAPRAERGGNSTLTGHMRFAYNSVEDLVPLLKDPSPEDLAAIADRLPRRTEADLWDETMLTTEGMADQELLKVHVGESYNTVRWLASKGHTWEPSYANPTSANVVSMSGGGAGLQQRNFAYLEEYGASFHYEAAVTELLQDDRGRVNGVRVLTPRGVDTVRARAVVLACGGFEANPEMRARYLGPRWDTVKMRGVPYNTGEGLRMALAVGAMPYGSWSSCHASPQDVARPAFSQPSAAGGSNEFNRYVYPFSIMVNRLGQRFVDEADEIRALTYAKMGRAILAQPGGVAFQVLDAKARRLKLYPASYAHATGAKADTLEGLAQQLGIDVAGFVQTVWQYNAAIPAGARPNPNPFRKDGVGTVGLKPPKSNFALSVEEPPFEGWAVCCGITFTFGGLKIDPQTAQVQHVAGWPIPGLYAAGEMVGGLFHWNYPSGSGMMSGATFGRIAGASAAREVRA